jgi:hypothetical protein
MLKILWLVALTTNATLQAKTTFMGFAPADECSTSTRCMGSTLETCYGVSMEDGWGPDFCECLEIENSPACEVDSRSAQSETLRGEVLRNYTWIEEVPAAQCVYQSQCVGRKFKTCELTKQIENEEFECQCEMVSDPGCGYHM